MLSVNFISLAKRGEDLSIFQLQQEIQKKSDNDAQKISLLLKLAYLYEDIDLDSSIIYYQKALDFSLIVKDTILLTRSYFNLGATYYLQSSYDKAIQYYQLASDFYQLLENHRGIANCYYNIASVYSDLGESTKALKYYLKALKIYEKIHLQNGLSASYNSIGVIYYNQKEYTKALSYYQQAYRIDSINQYQEGMADYFNNIGAIYYNQNQLDKALHYYLKSLNIERIIKNNSGIALSYNNIGLIQSKKMLYKSAIESYQNAIHYYEKVGNKNKLALAYASIASLNINLFDKYNKQTYLKEAVNYAQKAYFIAQEINSLPRKINALNHLRNAYKLLKSYNKSIYYTDLYIAAKDSLFNIEKHKGLAELEAKYQFHKKIAIDSIASAKKLEIQNLELKRVKSEKNMLIGGAILLLVFSILIFRSYNQKRKINIGLQLKNNEIMFQHDKIVAQKDEIEAQRDTVELQKERINNIYKEISQSIDYAKRIQNSTLPNTSYLQKNVEDHFIFFKPKDVVSGDFYWWAKIEDDLVLAVADCTGHGVPGAIMSMLGMSLLKETVVKEYISHPGVILRRLRKEVINTLQQKGEIGEQKDGMDMAIVAINYKNKSIQFSGANNPLYIITDTELKFENEKSKDLVKKFDSSDLQIDSKKLLYEIKPDKMPIAIYEKMNRYTTHSFVLNKGDQLYMFSDGYADQFGGPKGKKFMRKAFKRLLLSNAHLSMETQKNKIINVFEEWKSSQEQVDDIVILGIKL